MTYTDETQMPFGVHKGTKLANVPADYMLWLYSQPYIQNPSSVSNTALKAYIKDNMSALIAEKRQTNRR